jgi:hypothetical protein
MLPFAPDEFKNVGVELVDGTPVATQLEPEQASQAELSVIVLAEIFADPFVIEA